MKTKSRQMSSAAKPNRTLVRLEHGSETSRNSDARNYKQDPSAGRDHLAKRQVPFDKDQKRQQNHPFQAHYADSGQDHEKKPTTP
jgi:hypothetical protein